ncbi:MAG: NAD(P)/FAD-dependent oxidoreductase [Cyanobacteria bacterium]|nr:NAD(P)/FAD-dependent oxidoreductase [Cyanobacteriota bacterium]
MPKQIFEIAVIGAGAAGQMGLLRSVLNNKDTIVFKGDAKTNKKSRATWVSHVVNMPYSSGIPRPIGSATTSSLQWIQEESEFASKLTVVADAVSKLTKNQDGIFELETAKGESYQAKYVLLATGIMDMQPEIDGSIQPVLPFANKGHIDYCLRCDGHKSLNKITATIGHGAPAAWVAIMLHERYQPPELKIFTNGHEPEFSDDVKELLKLYDIKVITEAIKSIKGDPKTKMEAVELEGGKFEPVEFAFALLGQIAYNELALQVGAEVNAKGNVVCGDKGESSVPGLYVAGDLRDTGKYQIYTAWDQAVDSIDDMDAKLRLAYREAKRTVTA